MVTVSQLRSRIGRMINDPTLAGYEDGLFYDAIGAAFDAILPWVPKTETLNITGTGASSYSLPADFYQAESCEVVLTGELLPESIIIPGHYRGDTIANTNDWILYPHGQISFSKSLSVGEVYRLYYLAHWIKPTSSANLQDAVEPPEYAHNGILLYASAYMILPSAISASEVRQFNTKVDSGTPEHNPMQASATYLLKLFLDEMNRHPRHQKAQR